MKKLSIIILLFCAGCASQQPPALYISLANNDSALKITGLNSTIISEIARDTSADFEALVSVYKMPADTDMKDYQPNQPGKYSVKDDALIFTPDTPFAHQQLYFVRYYQYSTNNSAWDFLKHKRSISRLHYVDMPFKP